MHFPAKSGAAEPGLLFGFYETVARLDAKIAGVCPPLRGLIDSGAVEVQWQPPTDDLLDAYAERLLLAVHRRKVRRLFIDGLGALQKASGNEPGRMGNFLTVLMNEMRVLGVTTLYAGDDSGRALPRLQGFPSQAVQDCRASSLGEDADREECDTRRRLENCCSPGRRRQSLRLGLDAAGM